MALELFPNELLVQIIKESIPEGFEGLALTCRRVYDATAGFRKRHNQLRRQYRYFDYGDRYIYADKTRDDWNRHHASKYPSSLDLLVKIAEEPLIARYIVHANFECDGLFDLNIPSNRPRPDENRNLIIRRYPDLLLLLESSTYLQRDGTSPTDFLKALVHSNEYHTEYIAAVFLLTLLPNVMDIRISQKWKYIDATKDPEMDVILYRLVEQIALRANDPSEPMASLSRLKSVIACDNNELGPFIHINSVSTLGIEPAWGINWELPDKSPCDPQSETYGTGLEVVECAIVCLTPTELRTFLLRLPGLRTLNFNLKTVHNSPKALEIIRDVAAATVETLSFSIYDSESNITPGVPSMKPFSRLRDLELALNVLVGREVYIPKVDNSKGSEKSYRLPRLLTDWLPLSLERLCLLVADLPGSVADLVYLFSSGSKMPNLRNIVIRYTLRYPIRGTRATDRVSCFYSWGHRGHRQSPWRCHLRDCGHKSHLVHDYEKTASEQASEQKVLEPAMAQVRAQVLLAFGPVVSVKFVGVVGPLVPAFMDEPDPVEE